jgi:hypothetical protein
VGEWFDAVSHDAELVLEIIIKNVLMVQFRAQMSDKLTLQRQSDTIDDNTPVHRPAGIFLGYILKTCTDEVHCVKEGAVGIEKVAVILFHDTSPVVEN